MENNRRYWGRLVNTPMRVFPHFHIELDPTPAEAAILCTLFYETGGKVEFEVIIKHITEKARVSSISVKRLIKKLIDMELFEVQPRLVTSAGTRQKPNRYKVKCTHLLEWGELINNAEEMTLLANDPMGYFDNRPALCRKLGLV